MAALSRGSVVSLVVVIVAAAIARVAGIGRSGRSIGSGSSTGTFNNNMGWKNKFRTVDDVPKDYFDQHKSIYAFVERVIDGDTIRVRHLPGYNWRRWKHPEPLRQRGIASDTLSVRIYGVDCPELAHNGFSQKGTSSSSQPYGPEARDYTSCLVLHRVVKITFLRKDQYKRAVAKVETVPSRFYSWIPFAPFQPRDVSVELATVGLAELYTGGGAEYCNNRDRLERRIERAQRKKRGMWSLGDQRVSAADHKKRGNTVQQHSQPPPKAGARAAVVSAATRTTPLPSGLQRPRGRKRDKVLDRVLTGLELGAG